MQYQFNQISFLIHQINGLNSVNKRIVAIYSIVESLSLLSRATVNSLPLREAIIFVDNNVKAFQSMMVDHKESRNKVDVDNVYRCTIDCISRIHESTKPVVDALKAEIDKDSYFSTLIMNYANAVYASLDHIHRNVCSMYSLISSGIKNKKNESKKTPPMQSFDLSFSTSKESAIDFVFSTEKNKNNSDTGDAQVYDFSKSNHDLYSPVMKLVNRSETTVDSEIQQKSEPDLPQRQSDQKTLENFRNSLITLSKVNKDSNMLYLIDLASGALIQLGYGQCTLNTTDNHYYIDGVKSHFKLPNHVIF